SSAKLPYVPMPALFTSTSTGASLSRRRSCTVAMPASSTRSATSDDARTPYCSCTSFASASSRALSRATSTTSCPRAASCAANSRPIPAVAPVTTAVCLVMSEVERGGDRVGAGLDGFADADLADRALGILESVSRDRAHDDVVGADNAVCSGFEQARDRGCGRGLHETPFLGGEGAVRVEDARAGEGTDVAAGFVACRDRALPRSRVADADRGRDRFGVQHRLAEHDRGCAGRLPPEHAREARRLPERVVFGV